MSPVLLLLLLLLPLLLLLAGAVEESNSVTPGTAFEDVGLDVGGDAVCRDLLAAFTAEAGGERVPSSEKRLEADAEAGVTGGINIGGGLVGLGPAAVTPPPGTTTAHDTPGRGRERIW
jgi:hypothetical protein